MAPKPGSVYAFRLKNGMFGALRVIRGPNANEKTRKGVLVIVTRFTGEKSAVMKSPDVKKALPGVQMSWVEGDLPSTFELVGEMDATDQERAKESHVLSPWEMFPNVVYRQWRNANEPEVVARELEADRIASEKKLAEEVAELKAHDGIHLENFLPLAKPKNERTPEEVLRGFIAAMNQWEKECARIDKKTNHLSFHVSADAMQKIYDELCTKKDRAYGRRGNYSTPPEYDPKTERITNVTTKAKRAEIETERKGGLVRQARYVLVKTDAGWLIDKVFHDGRASIL